MEERIPSTETLQSVSQAPSADVTEIAQNLKKLEKDLNLKVKNTEDELKNQKKEFITIFGIFVSFLTYISVEIQILKNAPDLYTLAGLSVLLLGAILLFSIILNLKDDENIIFKPVFWVLVLMFSISAICFYNAPTKNLAEQQKKLLEKIEKLEEKYLRTESLLSTQVKYNYPAMVEISIKKGLTRESFNKALLVLRDSTSKEAKSYLIERLDFTASEANDILKIQ